MSGGQPSGGSSLDEVARLSGVSRSTASRALNGREGVRADVRERVQLMAQSIGYRPNRAAQTLATGRTSVLGLVLPPSELPVNPYGASIVQGITYAADRHNEGLMLLLARDDPGSVVADTIRDGIIDGIVVVPSAIGARWVEEFDAAGFPTVLIGSHPDLPEIPSVDVNNHDGMAGVVEHLAERGCRRIAHIHGPLHRPDAQARLAGFRAAHEKLGLPIDESLVVAGDYTRRTGQRLAAELLKSRPDAIVGSNDETAIGILRAAERAGVSVPDDVAITGFDGTAVLDLLEVELTTVVQPFDEMCDAAVTVLISLLAGEEVPLRQIVDTTLVISESSPRLEATAD